MSLKTTWASSASAMVVLHSQMSGRNVFTLQVRFCSCPRFLSKSMAFNNIFQRGSVQIQIRLQPMVECMTGIQSMRTPPCMSLSSHIHVSKEWSSSPTDQVVCTLSNTDDVNGIKLGRQMRRYTQNTASIHYIEFCLAWPLCLVSMFDTAQFRRQKSQTHLGWRAFESRTVCDLPMLWGQPFLWAQSKPRIL